MISRYIPAIALVFGICPSTCPTSTTFSQFTAPNSARQESQPVMRVATFISALCAATLASANPRTAQIYIQPLAVTSTNPEPLAEVSYDPLSLDTTSIVAYEAPEIPETADLVRIGLYDPKSSQWISGTTVAS